MSTQALSKLLPATALLFGSCAMQAGMPFAQGVQRSSIAANVTASEVEFDGGGTQEIDTVEVNLGHAYFFTPNFELGGRVEYSESDVEGGADQSTAIVTAAARYYFATDGSARPFAEVSAGIGDAEAEGSMLGETLDDSVVGYSGSLGSLFFVTENTALEARARFQVIDADSAEREDLSLLLGYSLFF